MANNEQFLIVEIPISRYEELLKAEERVEIAERYLKTSDFCNKDMMLTILGKETENED